MTRRIGITQRVEVIAAYNERRDCLDQRWGDLLEAVGMFCIPLANRPEIASDYLEAQRVDGLILSGGNDLGALEDAESVASERDAFEGKVLEWAGINNTPVLGVCRGFQLINQFCGGSIVPVEGHVKSRHKLVPTNNFSELALMDTVNSYHNYGIPAEGLADELMPLAFADDGTVEAFKHRNRSWYGIMWHPEREKAFHRGDLELFKRIFGE